VDHLVSLIEAVRQNKACLVIQEAAFDLTVLLRYADDVESGKQVGNGSSAQVLRGLIWEILDVSMDREWSGGQPLVHDTIIREKLLNLSTIGSIDEFRGRPIPYSLADLVYRRFNYDIKASKVSMGADGRILDHAGMDITGSAQAGASWRLRYSELDSVPLSLWPAAAVSYAIEDATWARKVFVHQEQERKPSGYSSANSGSLQVAAATALRLVSSVGFPVDMAQVERVRERVCEVTQRVQSLLVDNGILRTDGTVCKANVQARMEAAWAIKGERPKMTEGTENTPPAIACSEEALDALEGLDPVLDAYRERQGLNKIATAFLPSLANGHIWSNYDTLKETGRVSSYGSSDSNKKKAVLYDAMNIQQIPRGHGIRECFLPPVGAPIIMTRHGEPEPSWVFVSDDYNSMELCSVAQVTHSLFGASVHREKINAGYDLHSYLGAAIAMHLQPELLGNPASHEDAYRELRRLAKLKINDQDWSEPAADMRKRKDRAKEYRDFAKPTGLGYPGGLGPATMRTMAKANYGIDISEDMTKLFRDLWHQTYPEMRQYFDWVNRQEDMQRPGDDGYVYETQGFNRFRAGATYCATANGKAMQSLGADGAKRSAFWLAKAAFGGMSKDSPYSILNGCLPAAFIHDENLWSSPYDDLFTERALLASQLMVDAMQVHMPDVRISVEPAAMRRWTKKAEPEWVDEPGRERRVEEAICRVYGGVPPKAWCDEFFLLLGPDYNPNRKLVPWDDVHELRL
jgi:hypothetical protein